MLFHLSPVSSNIKTGPIPVSTSSRVTCNPDCPFLGKGCYAENFPLKIHWDAVTRGDRGQPLPKFLASVEALPENQLLRHNQAGDFPHTGGRISRRFVRRLVKANRGKKGSTYTPHDLSKGENLALIRQANRQGFAVNVSTETELAADAAVASGLPAVLAVPDTETRTAWNSPAGNRVVVCPAQRPDSTVTCATCAICHTRPAKLIVAFIAHGASKAKASAAIAGAQ